MSWVHRTPLITTTQSCIFHLQHNWFDGQEAWLISKHCLMVGKTMCFLSNLGNLMISLMGALVALSQISPQQVFGGEYLLSSNSGLNTWSAGIWPKGCWGGVWTPREYWYDCIWLCQQNSPRIWRLGILNPGIQEVFFGSWILNFRIKIQDSRVNRTKLMTPTPTLHKH